jgi:lipopolysaccharide transport system ATP-binding protein
METVIKVENLSKKFTRSLKRGMFYGSVDLMKSLVGIRVNTEELRTGEFWALDNVNFEIKKGETFGVLGRNGSGKSTLLRILNGIFPPDTGQVTMRGRVGALIAVGAGFHPHMTGRENIYLNGVILGMKLKEIEEKLDMIVDFADIGDFIDAPVSTYSSGMTVRLGFSIAIHAEVEILLVDEVLAVGDVSFRRKSFEKILELQKKGVTTIFISHNLAQMEKICQRALLLDKGKQIYIGDVRSAIEEYQRIINKSNMTGAKGGVGLDNVEFLNPKVYSEDGDEIKSGQRAYLEFEYKYTSQKSPDIQLRVTLNTKEGRTLQKFILQEKDMFEGKEYNNVKIMDLPNKARVRLEFDTSPLAPGVYVFDVALIPRKNIVHDGGIANFVDFEVLPKPGNYYDFAVDSLLDIDFTYEVEAEK